MRVTLAVDAGDGDAAGASDDLYQWLRQDPDLRVLVRREVPAAPPDGAMGALGELISLLLAPGGPTAAVGAAVVVWLQNRRGNQTVTLGLPDGTQVVVSSEKVRGLTAEGASELAERVADALRQERDPRSVPGTPGPREAREPEGTRGARVPGTEAEDGGRVGPSAETD
ncbi:effector-associated constant component EACC1 [Streptomyces prasinus]|uniref:effector-associated constant component EACC1 n=1 Tax=Streptomyces prasinus TaxID=67345 RepID=UPI00362D7356